MENPYLQDIIAQIPRVLSLIDRESFSKSYGCGDRVFWSWKFTDFPGARFQEYIFFLAWLYKCDKFDNEFKGNKQILRLCEAGFKFWTKIQYPNGSFDEAYPYENSLAAVSFTAFYLSEAFELIQCDISDDIKKDVLVTFKKVGEWLKVNDEKHGVLSNHLAVAAAAALNISEILNDETIYKRSHFFLDRILQKQSSSEGWYEEYGGADVGYQTHGSFYLARIWQKTQNSKLLDSLKCANQFIQYFIHPDGSVGGEYSSRNTGFYFPAAYEMLASDCEASLAISNFQRCEIEKKRTVGLLQMDSYNLYPMLNNYIFAYENSFQSKPSQINTNLPWQKNEIRFFEEFGVLFYSNKNYLAILGVSKGGTLSVWNKNTTHLAYKSSGYILSKNNQNYSNQSLGQTLVKELEPDLSKIALEAQFIKVNQTLMTPLKFILFRIFNITFGKVSWIGYWLKRLLVKVLVTKKESLDCKLERRVEFKESCIIVRDNLLNCNFSVKHLSDFSSIHMGSSRYVHVEQFLNNNNSDIKESYNSNGVLVTGEVLV